MCSHLYPSRHLVIFRELSYLSLVAKESQILELKSKGSHKTQVQLFDDDCTDIFTTFFFPNTTHTKKIVRGGHIFQALSKGCLFSNLGDL